MKAIPCLQLLLLSGLAAQDRPAWDQHKAEAKVRRVLAIEKQGQPWNRIDWLADPAAAAKQAKKSGKPILVYFYLRTDKGPAAAPC